MARPATPMTTALDEVRDGALSLADAAKFLAVCERTVRQLVRDGELESVPWGRKPRVLLSQCRLLLARQLEEARRRDAEHAPPRSPGGRE